VPELRLGYRRSVGLDYYVWRGPSLTADEFGQRLQDFDELDLDEASLFEWSSRLVRFRREVLARYPALEEISDASDTPWSMTPVESTRFIVLNLRSSVTKDQIVFVVRRAHGNGLYIYDAQEHEVYAPGPGSLADLPSEGGPRTVRRSRSLG
jgi:hypothetical protein